jgi:membrane protease YdiL (CAAX protease family)
VAVGGPSPIEVPEASAQELTERFPPWWIAILSGLIFGLAHFEYGVSWVPLVVLGTVLARVYQLQRSILPCILMHGLFNSLAMVGFAVELFGKPPT